MIVETIEKKYFVILSGFILTNLASNGFGNCYNLPEHCRIMSDEYRLVNTTSTSHLHMESGLIFLVFMILHESALVSMLIIQIEAAGSGLKSRMMTNGVTKRTVNRGVPKEEEFLRTRDEEGRKTNCDVLRSSLCLFSFPFLVTDWGNYLS
jgi:hypothetical protein